MSDFLVSDLGEVEREFGLESIFTGQSPRFCENLDYRIANIRQNQNWSAYPIHMFVC
jgi:hypothetical protein